MRNLIILLLRSSAVLSALNIFKSPRAKTPAVASILAMSKILRKNAMVIPYIFAGEHLDLLNYKDLNEQGLLALCQPWTYGFLSE